jgi:hypothetical protein
MECDPFCSPQNFLQFTSASWELCSRHRVQLSVCGGMVPMLTLKVLLRMGAPSRYRSCEIHSRLVDRMCIRDRGEPINIFLTG